MRGTLWKEPLSLSKTLSKEMLLLNRMFPQMDWYIGFSSWEKLRLSVHEISGAPEKVRGLKIFFASDLHLSGNVSPQPLIDCIKSTNPDMILFGGDFADTRDQALRVFDALGMLHAPLGIFSAPGNNDIEAFGSCEALRSALQSCGVCLLANESVSVGGLRIAGVEEKRYGQPMYDELFDSSGEYRILLSHYPLLPERALPDLMLSGHTHGGQFNALGLTPYAIGFERTGILKHLAPLAVSGLHDVNGMKLLVSKGLGTSRIPLRIGVRPEVHLLKFDC